jgi:hypothetical protein
VTASQPRPLNPENPSADEGDALTALLLTAAAEAAAAVKGTPGRDAGTRCLAYIAETGDGVMLLDDVLKAGHSRAVVAALLRQPNSDKRRQPALGLAEINDTATVWLKTGSWSLLGFPNRKEAAPTASSIRHRLAGHNFETALRAACEGPMYEHRIMLDVLRGADLRAYVASRIGDAWGPIRYGGPEESKEASKLLGGVYPDALVVENWPTAMAKVAEQVVPGGPTTYVSQRLKSWPTNGGTKPREDAELRIAVELELHSKHDPVQSAKIAAHDCAMALGWWDSVCWITDSDRVREKLLRSGLADRHAHPGHYLMGGSTVGLGADPAPVSLGTPLPSSPWWLPMLEDHRR